LDVALARTFDHNDWYNHALGYSVANQHDNLSGIESCDSAASYSGPDANPAGVSRSCTDKAGNTGNASASFKFDKTAPTLDVALARGFDYGDWYNHALGYSVANQLDNLSGIESCDPSASYSTPDADPATVSRSCMDNAGNSASASKSFRFDATAPTISGSRTPGPNTFGWNNTTVTAQFTCNDNLSDVDTCEPDHAFANEGQNQSFTGAVFDKAGNTSSATVGSVSIDKTAPNAPTAAADRAPEYDQTGSANDWWKDTVTITFGGAGDPALADSSAGSGVDPSTVPTASTYTAAGVFSKSGTVKDKAGNTSASTTFAGNVDPQKPIVTINCGSVLLGGTGSAGWTASDPTPGSGLSTAASGGVAYDSSAITPPAKTATAPVATDRVGHVSNPASCTYSVNYRWDGFLQPINDTAHQIDINQSVFKAGSTIPAKLELKRADGTVVLAATAPQWLPPQKLNQMSAAVDEDTFTVAPDTGGYYRPTGTQYIYNWSTKGLQSGYWYKIFAKFDDGQTYSVIIGLR
jgi:hypothetical protein